MSYRHHSILSTPVGNNALSYTERRKIHGKNPELFIPSLISGNTDDVTLGEKVVFEEIENGALKSCLGLKHFVQLSNSKIPTTIFDNHNHALYFWIEALQSGKIQPGFELIHIDEHSDLWPNEYLLDKEKSLSNLEYAWEFTNHFCNVGNYILPARGVGIIGKMLRIENEFQVKKYLNYTPPQNTVLNIDLDFFAPELDFIDEGIKLELIRNLIPQVACITIATSPFFIEQKRALGALHKIFDY